MTAAITMFLFGAITAAFSLTLPIGTARAPGTGFFPLLLGLMLLALALADGVRIWRSQPKTAQAAVTPASRDKSALRLVRFGGAVVLATALLRPLGYPGVSLLLMLALLRGLGVGWRASAAIALLTALACQLVFVHWLHIPLPAGVFGY